MAFLPGFLLPPTFELSHLGHGWVLPNNQLVLGKAMTRDKLLVVGRPEDGAHLWKGGIMGMILSQGYSELSPF